MDALIAVAAGFGGAIGMVLLLLVAFGDRCEASMDPCAGDVPIDLPDQALVPNSYEIPKPHEPFIPMPGHLKTNDEMVAWMTEQLPKLTAEAYNPRM